LKKVLLTGIAGFIGSHLSEKLLESGYKVVGLDCFTPYYSKEQKIRNLQKSLGDKNCTFVEGNVLDVDLKSLLMGVDVILHLAAQPGVRPSWSDFEMYVRHNILATKKLLDAALDSGKKKFIFASSSSVYGDAESFPTTEEMTPRPVSPYGITKDTCEKLCRIYHKSYDIPVAVLRFFTVFGPRQRPDMAFHKFIESMLSGEQIVIYGDGNQIRDFTYVGDIVQGTVSTIETEFDEVTLNLGSARPIRLIEVINSLQKIIGSQSKLVFSEFQKGDATKTLADISRAKAVIKYQPNSSFEDGLRAQVEWHRQKRGLVGESKDAKEKKV
jgi:nucleoside-diphosphate-sugar epimerase